MTPLPEIDPQAVDPVGKLASISIDSTDPSALADFYAALLGMKRVFETPDGHLIAISDGTHFVTMMYAEDHVAPTWPEPDRPQQMHLDVAVNDLETAVANALALGATEAGHQPAPGTWRILIDPAGHPFCLTTVTPD
jgi:catechol 2,3-dioxygenase-like lactoylglutathione lyase family enzyme